MDDVTDNDVLLYRLMYNDDDDDDDEAEFYEMNKILDKSEINQDINTGWEELDRELRECTLSQGRNEQEDELRRRVAEEQRQEEAESREKIKYRAPGLNVFTERPFRHFMFDQLDLVRDFGYELRAKQRGFASDDVLLKILKSPVRFIMFLSPESTSNLVQDAKDFASVCDFLFYSVASYCSLKETTLDHCEMFRKALFDLLRNYGFDSWKLQLSHIIAPLLNLGCDRKVIMNARLYRTLLETPISRGKKYKSDFAFHLPKLPRFAAAAAAAAAEGKENLQPELNHDLLKSYFACYFGDASESNYAEKLLVLTEDAVEQFFKLLADLVLSFSNDKCLDSLMPRTSDWTNTLALFYVLTTVALDKHLILNSEVQHCTMLMLQELFDSFSTFQWTGCDKGAAEEEEAATEEHAKRSACNDLLETMCKSSLLLDDRLKTWKKSDVPPALTHDHHHNLIARIRMLPPSYRGNNVKKDIAFIWLSTMICPTDNITIGMGRNIGHVAEFLKDNECAMSLLFDDVYAMLSVLRLIDAVSGAETIVDNHEFHETSLKAVSRTFEKYLMKLGKGNDEDAYHRARDLFTQVLTKWVRYQEVEKPSARQQSIAKYTVPSS